MCNDGNCIPKDWACDGVSDCINGSDEDAEFCSVCPFQFLCTDGRCTDVDNVCDGINQCRDNSDEDQICVGMFLNLFISACFKNHQENIRGVVRSKNSLIKMKDRKILKKKVTMIT